MDTKFSVQFFQDLQNHSQIFARQRYSRTYIILSSKQHHTEQGSLDPMLSGLTEVMVESNRVC